MSYLVLARKWRPKDFEGLVGQEHVVRALTHALSTQRLHHAWLFTGTRGVGKTTLSRILAKSLNCETGITATPCGQCRACTEIDSGRFVDYVELDAASNRGVDEMTSLLEQAVYAPAMGRFKVYMIDEVHMLSGHAFNAMLKTLEEPPPHVKFILATTDPQKIPPTILSRCLQFNLKQMPADSIAQYLAYVLEQEQISFEAGALSLIGRSASGSMRDALSLTDQAIAYSASNLTLEAVQGMLGSVDQTHLIRLLQAWPITMLQKFWRWPMPWPHEAFHLRQPWVTWQFSCRVCRSISTWASLTMRPQPLILRSGSWRNRLAQTWCSFFIRWRCMGDKS